MYLLGAAITLLGAGAMCLAGDGNSAVCFLPVTLLCLLFWRLERSEVRRG